MWWHTEVITQSNCHTKHGPVTDHPKRKRLVDVKTTRPKKNLVWTHFWQRANICVPISCQHSSRSPEPTPWLCAFGGPSILWSEISSEVAAGPSPGWSHPTLRVWAALQLSMYHWLKQILCSLSSFGGNEHQAGNGNISNCLPPIWTSFLWAIFSFNTI